MRRVLGLFGAVLLIMSIVVTLPACTRTPEIFPEFTARAVPSPAPSPWSGVATYTEETYRIEAKRGIEFAIAMHAENIVIPFVESHDPQFLSLADNRTLGTTQWFLFKSLRSGKTEIHFAYPLEYRKVFSISIK